MTIKELRKEKGLTQAQFAQSIGVSTVTISAIEGGRLAVSAKLAGKVKEVYGVELERAEKKAAVKTAAKKAAAKKATKTAARAAVKKAAAENAPVKQLVKKVASVPLEIYIQSPYGGNITPEEVAARMPEGTEACFVRVDQNLIWWVKTDGSTGAVEIWPDNRA